MTANLTDYITPEKAKREFGLSRYQVMRAALQGKLETIEANGGQVLIARRSLQAVAREVEAVRAARAARTTAAPQSAA
jgi:hypothetical protein